jgi:hypothetical protein
MTDRGSAPRRRPRLSKRMLRLWAWTAGATALFAPLGALAVQPKIATDTAAPRRVIVHELRRRVIIVAPQQPTGPPRIVYVGGGSSSNGTSAPPTTTGGSGVPR